MLNKPKYLRDSPIYSENNLFLYIGNEIPILGRIIEKNIYQKYNTINSFKLKTIGNEIIELNKNQII